MGASVDSGVDARGVETGVALLGDAIGVAASGVASVGVPSALGVALGVGAIGVAARSVGAMPGVASGVDTMMVGMMMPLTLVGIGVETGVLVTAGGVHSGAFSRDSPDGPPATIIPISALAPIAKSTTNQRVRFTFCSRRQIACDDPLLAMTMPRWVRYDTDDGSPGSRSQTVAWPRPQPSTMEFDAG